MFVFCGTLLCCLAAAIGNFAAGMCAYIGQFVHQHELGQSGGLLHPHYQGHGALFLRSSLSSFPG